MTDALALYRLACDSHKRADWRRASHALAAALEAMQVERPLEAAPPPEAAPEPPLGPEPAFHSAPEGLHIRYEPAPIERLGRGKTLIAFLAERGIRDDGGELRALDGEKWHRGKAFRRRLVREDGLEIEEAAERAFDAGYFPEIQSPDWTGSDNSQPVSESELIEAIRQELAGRPRYAGEAPPADDDYWQAWEPEEQA